MQLDACKKTGKARRVSLGGEEQSAGASAGTTGEASPRAVQIPHCLCGAKQVPGFLEAGFLLIFFFFFFFPARLKELLKLPSSPGSPRGSLSFLHSESPLSKEIKMSFQKILVAQITIFSCKSQNLLRSVCQTQPALTHVCCSSEIKIFGLSLFPMTQSGWGTGGVTQPQPPRDIARNHAGKGWEAPHEPGCNQLI